MRSAGKTIPGAEIRILDPESDTIYPAGKTGEICIRAPGTMAGYWKQDDETARVIRDGEWVRSGEQWLLVNYTSEKDWNRELGRARANK